MNCLSVSAARLVMGIAALLIAAAPAMAHAGPGCPCRQQRPLAIPAANFNSGAPSLAQLRLRLDRQPDDHAARAHLEMLAADPDQALPKESAAYRSARELLPSRFIELQTRRFVVLSDASPQWTRAQAERLERAHHQFHRFAARLGLEPLPLEHKLVCVLFERRDEYRAFASAHDDVHDEWIAGYYSPRHDRIVFYNVDTDPAMEGARLALEGMKREMNELAANAELAMRRGDEKEAQRLRRSHGEFEQHIRQERQRVQAFAQRVSIATTVHEAIHQLAFHTRIQSPYVQNPLWLSEGLATAFETDTPHRAFGPDHEYASRREAFAEALGRGELLTLRELASLTQLAGADDHTVRTFYAQSYALFTWMSRFRRAELREYLDSFRREVPGTVAAERQIELFEEAFGDLVQLERAWLRHERQAMINR